MKKNIVITAAIIAAGSLAAYLLKRYLPIKKQHDEVNPRSHHITNLFSKAKRHAVEA